MMLGFVAFWTGIALVAYIVIVLILLILHEMQIEKPLLTTGLLFVVILLLVYIGRRSLFAAVELSVATILFVIVLGVFKSSLLSDQKKKIEALLMDRNILDKRRAGWKYAKTQAKLFKFMKQQGFIGNGQYIKSCVIRSGSALAPNWLRKLMFEKVLRN